MDYDKIGEKIRRIREKELKLTREEFAEEISVSIQTATRLENATSRVNNIETFLKISEITGYTIEELLLEKDDSKNRERIKRKIDYLLNVISEEELEYIYVNINQFIKFTHKNEITTLKNIKEKSKNDKKEIF